MLICLYLLTSTRKKILGPDSFFSLLKNLPKILILNKILQKKNIYIEKNFCAQKKRFGVKERRIDKYY